MSIFESLLHNPLIMSIEIGILTYFIYIIIKFAKQTRAIAVFNGVILIIALKILSDIFHFYAISFVINHIITWGVIAIIIIFQPEIRRSLEQLGNSVFVKKDDVIKDSDAIIESIVNASFYLSKRYIGALICIENRSTLKQYASTGVPLNANLSSQLLINMFTPNTPLHDGAVIIRQKTIVAASCMLPLTENSDVPQELGTRHRAGIGLSEHSDAVIIVISEETGDVSVAYKHELFRQLNQDDLTNLLQTHVASFNKGGTKQRWQTKLKQTVVRLKGGK